MRAVATDIDGTFLTNRRDYDRQLFDKVYAAMVEKDIRFIVASGDQYYFLRSLFPQVADQLAFVAENGVLTIDRGTEVHCGRLTMTDAQAVIEYLEKLPGVNFIVCGRRSAYVLKSAPAEFRTGARRFYTRIKEVADFSVIQDDVIFKFALNVPPAQQEEISQEIDTRFAGIIRATSSGNGSIDLIIPGMDKSHGLKLLLTRWGISPRDLVVFGDGENDLEMFELAGTSYAMGNAPQNVQAAATHVIGTNDEQAVLHTLEKLGE